MNRMPVLVSARSTTTDKNVKDVGHAFIIDRYKRYRIVSKNYYEWVYDSRPSDKPVPMVPEKIEYTYSLPNISAIGINWGWGWSRNNQNEWFSLTGDWICSDPGMSSYNWNINRNMIYGFQVVNK